MRVVDGKIHQAESKDPCGHRHSSLDFSALCQLLVRLGFVERVRGSHHIFTRDGVEEIVNLQPKGGKTKAYQVKQIRGLLVKYQFGETDVYKV